MGKPAGVQLRQRLDEEEVVVAPDLYLLELNSALKKHWSIGQIDRDTALDLYRKGADLVCDLVSSKVLNPEVMMRCIQLDHSPYDIAYLVLAKRQGAALMTLDRKLARLCDESNVRCITHEAA